MSTDDAQTRKARILGRGGLPDSENAKFVNEQENPRKEVPNEATQVINPITKQRYHDDLRLYSEVSSPFYYDFLGRTSDFITYQLTLARRDYGSGKMSAKDYENTKDLVGNLIHRMQEGSVPLALISSPDGLDEALKQIDQDIELRRLKSRMGLIDEREYISHSGNIEIVDLLLEKNIRKFENRIDYNRDLPLK
jgi:hypothetical protein